MTILDQLATLPGLITNDVGEVLYRYASSVPEGQNIVELGSYHGKSTAYLAAGAQAGNKNLVFAVDAWSVKVTAWSKYHATPSLQKFREALASVELSNHVIAARGLTAAVAGRYKNKPVGLLYVDADHSEQAVVRDVHAWMPHLVKGAWVIFDDYGTTKNPEVETAVAKLCRRNGRLVFDHVEVDRLAICRVR